MTGSLQIKNNKFYVVLNVYENGTRKPKWIPTGLPIKGNKKRAEKVLRDNIREYEIKAGHFGSDILFSEYAKIWAEKSKSKIDEITFQGYDILLQKHIFPYFEVQKTTLQEITPKALQSFFDEKLQNGRLDGKGGLSPNSVRHIKNVVYQILKEAVKSELIQSNPCEYIDIPPNVKPEIEVYSVEQVHTLYKAIENDVIGPLIHIAIIYGLRRSEVLGLKWDSIDFENGTFCIKHTVAKVTSVIEKDKTKNKSSHRSFPLTDTARLIFLSAKKKEEENRSFFGKAYQENDYVFKWDDGHTFSPDFISHHFSSILKKNNLPHIKFHALRHTCASLLINNGFQLKFVQAWMGHSDIRMTADIYGHFDISNKKIIADHLEQII